ncbi:MAG: methyltransferase domain-containing protein [Acidobacteriia bacterium]|nr:methyltransferase domain-containing protein [Terriglobia bacterium]
MSVPIPIQHIRDHYDRLSTYYRTLWGVHLHHGYWEDNEPQSVAQVNLVRKLAELAELCPSMHILDVGCGLGGSSLWLAENLEATVVGLTLSEVQARMAHTEAMRSGLEGRVSFHLGDARHLPFAAGRFDVVWIIECSEHVEDKQSFLAGCSRVLRIGGKLAICAWLKADGLSREEEEAFIEPVCGGFLCPSLETMNNYRRWMEESGFTVLHALDITPRVEKTWTVCTKIVQRPEVKLLLQLGDESILNFVNAFEAIRKAYAQRKMLYGMMVAEKR